MPSELLYTIIILSSILLSVGIILLCLRIHKKHIAIVKSGSIAYGSILSLNKKYTFHDIQTQYTYAFYCDYKSKFDRFSLDEHFFNCIEKNITFYKNLIDYVDENRKMYNNYCKEYDILYQETPQETIKQFRISFKTFKKIDRKLFAKAKLRPITNTSVYCSVEYTSPAGRNYYIKEKTYPFYIIYDYFKKAQELIEQKATRRYQIKEERAKMSNSLRYDILKRDNCTCQMCGATLQDGVKLHVDHIIPVSKGGKTEWGNLRTLCDRCNLGKSNKDE